MNQQWKTNYPWLHPSIPFSSLMMFSVRWLTQTDVIYQLISTLSVRKGERRPQRAAFRVRHVAGEHRLVQQKYLQPRLFAENIRTGANYFINHRAKQRCWCHRRRKVSAFMANVVKKEWRLGLIALGSLKTQEIVHSSSSHCLVKCSLNMYHSKPFVTNSLVGRCPREIYLKIQIKA